MTVATTEKDPAKFAVAIQQLEQGRSNAVGTCTLTPSATQTVVDAPNCGPNSIAFLTPLTANAAAALATTFVSAVDSGTFTLTHASAVSINRTFGFVCLG